MENQYLQVQVNAADGSAFVDAVCGGRSHLLQVASAVPDIYFVCNFRLAFLQFEANFKMSRLDTHTSPISKVMTATFTDASDCDLQYQRSKMNFNIRYHIDL
jgi:hypothetical protein